MKEIRMKRKEFFEKTFQGDLSIWVIFMLLCCFSLLEVFSATSTLAYKNATIWGPIARHASFLFVGFSLVLLMVHAHHKYFSLGILLLPISFVMLLITPFVGPNTNEAYRWLPLFGFQIQPSEVSKLGCVIYVAFLLSKRSELSDKTTFQWILWGIIPVCLLIFNNNLSTALILGGVCFLMMFIGQIPLRKLGVLLINLAVLSLLFVLLLNVMPPDLKKKYFYRFDTWIERWTSHTAELRANRTAGDEAKTYVITNDNYQVTHARIAIAKGGIFGKLPGRSVQRDFLPQAYSDFIYAIIIEELGVAGGICVLILYVMLMIRVGIIAKRCEKLFPKYLVLGCGLLIVIQALTHVAVNVGLCPVTGQPLPLISRGGTSTLVSCICIGVILSVSHFGAKMSQEDEEEEMVSD
jgi:cell division protein FtsW